ncbi:hypothetical protein TOPH_05598 [Tolypocladium ophioglossoides CBS 100239]|uniref:Uncharacterized protein n=1 Tax=Tolypocladium ophioglossoides (strain CBS 100239) TaxID=1163406 RepID=A0A0L0N682_TOLOC|nr:hypothetical protein TOPH_05598 [Tolypocladium ophioglossoides CBS 100239]
MTLVLGASERSICPAFDDSPEPPAAFAEASDSDPYQTPSIPCSTTRPSNHNPNTQFEKLQLPPLRGGAGWRFALHRRRVPQVPSTGPPLEGTWTAMCKHTEGFSLKGSRRFAVPSANPKSILRGPTTAINTTSSTVLDFKYPASESCPLQVLMCHQK